MWAKHWSYELSLTLFFNLIVYKCHEVYKTGDKYTYLYIYVYIFSCQLIDLYRLVTIYGTRTVNVMEPNWPTLPMFTKIKCSPSLWAWLWLRRIRYQVVLNGTRLSVIMSLKGMKTEVVVFLLLNKHFILISQNIMSWQKWNLIWTWNILITLIPYSII